MYDPKKDMKEPDTNFNFSNLSGNEIKNPKNLRLTEYKVTSEIDIEEEFESSLDSAREMIQREHSRTGIKPDLDRYKFIVVSMTIDGLHWQLYTSFDENENWHDETFLALSDYFDDKIKKEYKHIYR